MKDNILIYISKDGSIKVDVKMEDDNIWMSQDVMANLYECAVHGIYLVGESPIHA